MKCSMALAWTVAPLAVSIFLPPQLVFSDGPFAVGLPPHPDIATMLMATALSTAANRLNVNPVPHSRAEMRLSPCCRRASPGIFLEVIKAWNTAQIDTFDAPERLL